MSNVSNTTILIACCILLSTIYIIIEGMTNEFVTVKSSLDNRDYLVRDLPDKQEACDRLAYLRDKMVTTTKYLHKKHPTDERVLRLVERIKPDNISENANNSKHTSYCVNKGEEIVLCLRQKYPDMNKQPLVNHNTLLFVFLHEMSHIMTISTGHTDEFWSNFEFVLKEVIDGNIYQYEAFHKVPKKYCSIVITDTPYKM